jgi:hypothetical protein
VTATKHRRPKAATHTVYTPKLRDGKFARWLEIGSARRDGDIFDIELDRMLIDPADFTGYLRVTPDDREPPPPPDDELQRR